MSNPHDNPDSFDDLDDLESAWDLGLGEVFAADEDSADEDLSGQWCGRFRLIKEIARGGMGIVYRARDDRLERDVAIKIIRSDRLDEGDTIARFLEEAQIAGQLQHPGVVPIYETGLDEQDRPFFCMKLVEGETFSRILKKRSDPDENLGHMINLFSSLCQMVSFAHARGVIHRDLKPSNIMIGSFGEVQVLDWGFAKIMDSPGNKDSQAAKSRPSHAVRSVRSSKAGGSSASLSGSVLGTPRYMAPEQARGEIDEIDERCDVFALGAILCEILTGKSPHGGDSEIVTTALAAKGDMEGAFHRLQESDGPAALKELATWCLQPNKNLRPRNAFVVADAVAGHLDVLEASRHEAQVEARAAEHRLVQEQKARRLTVILGALVLFVITAGATLWWDRAEEQRRNAAERQETLRSLMSKAGENGRQGDWALLDETLAAAATIAEHPDIPRRLQMDFNFQQDRLLRLKKRSLTAEITRNRNQKLASSLNTIRLLPIDESERARKEYGEAFLAFGVDMDKDSAEAAYLALDRIPPHLRNKVVSAFDDWAARERSARPLDTSRPGPPRGENAETGLWRQLISAAQLLDRDTWRRQLRSFALDRDRNALRTLAGEDNIKTRNAQSMLLLAESLANVDEFELAKKVLWQGFVSHPDDFWINFRLSKNWDDRRGPERHLTMPSEDELRRAERHAWLATSLQPQSLVARLNLVQILLQLGEIAEAVSVVFDASVTADDDVDDLISKVCMSVPTATEYLFLLEARSRRRDNAVILPRLAQAALAAGDLQTAEEAAREGIRLGLGHDALRRSLCQLLFDQGRLDEAKELVNTDPTAPSMQRIRNQLDRLEGVMQQDGPDGLRGPGPVIHRARVLTWKKKAMAAARAWDDATGRRPGPRRNRPDFPNRPERGHHLRSLERDAVAALVSLALEDQTPEEEKNALGEVALRIADRVLRVPEPLPEGHVPPPLRREWMLWLVDPRLAPVRDSGSPVFTSAEHKKAWQQFWNTLRTGLR